MLSLDYLACNVIICFSSERRTVCTGKVCFFSLSPTLNRRRTRICDHETRWVYSKLREKIFLPCLRQDTNSCAPCTFWLAPPTKPFELFTFFFSTECTRCDMDGLAVSHDRARLRTASHGKPGKPLGKRWKNSIV